MEKPEQPDGPLIPPKTKRMQFAENVVHQMQTTGKVNQSQAVRDAGFNTNNPDVIGAQLMRDQDIQAIVRKALSKHKVNEERLAATLNDALNANETKLFSMDGKITDERDVPDWNARLKATEQATRLLRLIPKDDDTTVQTLVIVAPESQLRGGHSFDCKCSECIDSYAHRAKDAYQAPPLENA